MDYKQLFDIAGVSQYPKAKKLIQEVFDTNLDHIEPVINRENSIIFRVNIENETFNVIGEQVDQKNHVWEIKFAKITSPTSLTYDVDKTNKPFVVFSVVKQCIEQILSIRSNIQCILFVGSKKSASRCKLYQRLLKTFSIKSWDKEVIDSSNAQFFIYVNPKTRYKIVKSIISLYKIGNIGNKWK